MMEGKVGKWFVPVIAAVALLGLTSGGIAQTKQNVPSVSWVDIGWSVIPGLVEAPFAVRGIPPAPRPAKAARTVVAQRANNYKMPSVSWVDIGWSVVPGLVEAPFAVRGIPPNPNRPARRRMAKTSEYKTPSISWVDIGWSVVPGLVEAPFAVRGIPPAPRQSARVVKSK